MKINCFIKLIFIIPIFILIGCTTTTEQSHHSIFVLKNTQNNLKVGEIPPTETTGKNYQYCYGCVAFNYKDFGTFDSSSDNTLNTVNTSISSQIMGAIANQISVPNNFKTSINYKPQNPTAPAFVAQQTSLSVLKGDK